MASRGIAREMPGERFEAAHNVIVDALSRSAFPGAVVEIGDSTRPLWSAAFGRQTFSPDSSRVAVDTIYDLASLTKVLATTSLVMRAVEQGWLDLDDPVARHLPAWNRADRERVTVRDLLSHASGLPAHRHYYRELTGGAAEFLRAIRDEPLAYPPGTASVYSDLGFMLLGFILARDRTLVERFDMLKCDIAPADDLQFHPPSQWQRRTAPTEVDWWRSRLLRGEVHDENTFALGGAAGQAGLFGTAASVGSIARHLLQVLDGRAGAFRTETVQHFIARRTDVPGSRALGWDTMLPTSSCGERMSSDAFGHTGFTGTSLWIDPRRGVYVVLLTNRVHPTRSNVAIQRVRRAFHDACMEGVS